MMMTMVSPPISRLYQIPREHKIRAIMKEYVLVLLILLFCCSYGLLHSYDQNWQQIALW